VGMILLDRRLHQESRCAGGRAQTRAFEGPGPRITTFVALPIVLKPSATAASRNDPRSLGKEAAAQWRDQQDRADKQHEPAVTANTPRRHPAPMNFSGSSKPTRSRSRFWTGWPPRSRSSTSEYHFRVTLAGTAPVPATSPETAQHRECVEGDRPRPNEEPKPISVIQGAPVEAAQRGRREGRARWQARIVGRRRCVSGSDRAASWATAAITNGTAMRRLVSLRQLASASRARHRLGVGQRPERCE